MIAMRKMWIIFGAALLAGLMAGATVAQDVARDDAVPAPARTARVVAVTSDQVKHPDMAGLGDRILVEVENLDVLLARADGDCTKVVLFFGGLPLRGLEPERCDPDDGHVGFLLKRVTQADDSWHALLGRPAGFERSLAVTVGSSISRSIPTEVLDFRLVILPKREFYIFVILTAAILLLFWRFALTSDLVRDTGVVPPQGARRPFSLSRFQMAFWTLLVLAAYLFIGTVTGELDTITESVLALIGIGSGTALGSSLVDSGKRQDRALKNGRLGGEKAALEEAVTKLETAGETDKATAQKVRLAEVEARLAALAEPDKSASTGSFLRDVLGDAQGISLYRFQMFVWTLVLGVIFCASVYQGLTMPQFSGTLLGLMGISSGTYLGFKFPEPSAASGSQ